MAKKRTRKSKVVDGKVTVKGYVRKLGKLPPRSSGGRFRKRIKGKGPGQATLF